MELDLQRLYNINRRAVMWILFFAALWLLRDFFALVFLTFIFGFVMRNVAERLARATRAPYRLAVVIPYVVAVALLGLLIATAVPRLADEGGKFSKRVPDLFDKLAREVQQAAPRYGFEAALARYVEADLRATSADDAPRASGEPTASQPAGHLDSTEVLANRLQQLLLSFLPDVASDAGPDSLREVFRQFVEGVTRGTSTFLLAVLLSFLIVFDYDRITRELTGWQDSAPGRFFHEAAASVVKFSGGVGAAFQCQMIVALLNACITAVGLFVLGIQPLVLLITIVFLLGLIPVLGVFISSVPIILIAFNDYGLNRALLALLLIVVVHLLEAYVFNPRIYAARFHLNPVIVLIILLAGERLFGVWGLLLSIPVTHYVLNLARAPCPPRKPPRVPGTAPVGPPG